MAHEPKRRHSVQRKGKRRAAIHLAVSAGTVCPNCGKSITPHAVCKHCGFYKGKEILAKVAKQVQPAAQE